MSLVYMAVNTVNSKVYIGQTIRPLQERIDRHYDSAKRSKTHFHNALRKYDRSVIEWDILEDNIPVGELDNAEIFWIAYFKSIGAELYNLTNGGEGFRGKHSTESRLKMSQALKGKEAWNKGKRKPRIIKGTQCQGRSAKPYDVAIISPDGIVYSPIDNVPAFAKRHNLNQTGLYRLIYGDRKSYRGWRLV